MDRYADNRDLTIVSQSESRKTNLFTLGLGLVQYSFYYWSKLYILRINEQMTNGLVRTEADYV